MNIRYCKYKKKNMTHSFSIFTLLFFSVFSEFEGNFKTILRNLWNLWVLIVKSICCFEYKSLSSLKFFKFIFLNGRYKVFYIKGRRKIITTADDYAIFFQNIKFCDFFAQCCNRIFRISKIIFLKFADMKFRKFVKQNINNIYRVLSSNNIFKRLKIFSSWFKLLIISQTITISEFLNLLQIFLGSYRKIIYMIKVLNAYIINLLIVGNDYKEIPWLNCMRSCIFSNYLWLNFKNYDYSDFFFSCTNNIYLANMFMESYYRRNTYIQNDAEVLILLYLVVILIVLTSNIIFRTAFYAILVGLNALNYLYLTLNLLGTNLIRFGAKIYIKMSTIRQLQARFSAKDLSVNALNIYNQHAKVILRYHNYKKFINFFIIMKTDINFFEKKKICQKNIFSYAETTPIRITKYSHIFGKFIFIFANRELKENIVICIINFTSYEKIVYIYLIYNRYILGFNEMIRYFTKKNYFYYNLDEKCIFLSVFYKSNGNAFVKTNLSLNFYCILHMNKTKIEAVKEYKEILGLNCNDLKGRKSKLERFIFEFPSMKNIYKLPKTKNVQIEERTNLYIYIYSDCVNLITHYENLCKRKLYGINGVYKIFFIKIMNFLEKNKQVNDNNKFFRIRLNECPYDKFNLVEKKYKRSNNNYLNKENSGNEKLKLQSKYFFGKMALFLFIFLKVILCIAIPEELGKNIFHESYYDPLVYDTEFTSVSRKNAIKNITGYFENHFPKIDYFYDLESNEKEDSVMNIEKEKTDNKTDNKKGKSKVLLFGDLSLVTLNIFKPLSVVSEDEEDVKNIILLIDRTHPTIFALQGIDQFRLDLLIERLNEKKVGDKEEKHYEIINYDKGVIDSVTGIKTYFPIIYDTKLIGIKEVGYFETGEKKPRVYSSFAEIIDVRLNRLNIDKNNSDLIDEGEKEEIKINDTSYTIINGDLFSSFADTVEAMFFNIVEDVSSVKVIDKAPVIFMGSLGSISPLLSKLMISSYHNVINDDFNNKELLLTTDHTKGNDDNVQRDFILIRDKGLDKVFNVNYARILSKFNRDNEKNSTKTPHNGISRYPLHTILTFSMNIENKIESNSKNQLKETKWKEDEVRIRMNKMIILNKDTGIKDVDALERKIRFEVANESEIRTNEKLKKEMEMESTLRENAIIESNTGNTVTNNLYIDEKEEKDINISSDESTESTSTGSYNMDESMSLKGNKNGETKDSSSDPLKNTNVESNNEKIKGEDGKDSDSTKNNRGDGESEEDNIRENRPNNIDYDKKSNFINKNFDEKSKDDNIRDDGSQDDNFKNKNLENENVTNDIDKQNENDKYKNSLNNGIESGSSVENKDSTDENNKDDKNGNGSLNNIISKGDNFNKNNTDSNNDKVKNTSNITPNGDNNQGNTNGNNNEGKTPSNNTLNGDNNQENNDEGKAPGNNTLNGDNNQVNINGKDNEGKTPSNNTFNGDNDQENMNEGKTMSNITSNDNDNTGTIDEGKNSNSKTSNGNKNEGKTSNNITPNGNNNQGNNNEGEISNNNTMNGDNNQGKTSNNITSNDDNNTGTINEGKTFNGNDNEGKTSNNITSNGDNNEGKTSNNKTSNGDNNQRSENGNNNVEKNSTSITSKGDNNQENKNIETNTNGNVSSRDNITKKDNTNISNVGTNENISKNQIDGSVIDKNGNSANLDAKNNINEEKIHDVSSEKILKEEDKKLTNNMCKSKNADDEHKNTVTYKLGTITDTSDPKNDGIKSLEISGEIPTEKSLGLISDEEIKNKIELTNKIINQVFTKEEIEKERLNAMQTDLEKKVALKKINDVINTVTKSHNNEDKNVETSKILQSSDINILIPGMSSKENERNKKIEKEVENHKKVQDFKEKKKENLENYKKETERLQNDIFLHKKQEYENRKYEKDYHEWESYIQKLNEWIDYTKKLNKYENNKRKELEIKEQEKQNFIYQEKLKAWQKNNKNENLQTSSSQNNQLLESKDKSIADNNVKLQENITKTPNISTNNNNPIPIEKDSMGLNINDKIVPQVPKTSVKNIENANKMASSGIKLEKSIGLPQLQIKNTKENQPVTTPIIVSSEKQKSDALSKENNFKQVKDKNSGFSEKNSDTNHIDPTIMKKDVDNKKIGTGDVDKNNNLTKEQPKKSENAKNLEILTDFAVEKTDPSKNTIEGAIQPETSKDVPYDKDTVKYKDQNSNKTSKNLQILTDFAVEKTDPSKNTVEGAIQPETSKDVPHGKDTVKYTDQNSNKTSKNLEILTDFAVEKTDPSKNTTEGAIQPETSKDVPYGKDTVKYTDQNSNKTNKNLQILTDFAVEKTDPNKLTGTQKNFNEANGQPVITHNASSIDDSSKNINNVENKENANNSNLKILTEFAVKKTDPIKTPNSTEKIEKDSSQVKNTQISMMERDNSKLKDSNVNKDETNKNLDILTDFAIKKTTPNFQTDPTKLKENSENIVKTPNQQVVSQNNKFNKDSTKILDQNESINKTNNSNLQILTDFAVEKTNPSKQTNIQNPIYTTEGTDKVVAKPQIDQNSSYTRDASYLKEGNTDKTNDNLKILTDFAIKKTEPNNNVTQDTTQLGILPAHSQNNANLKTSESLKTSNSQPDVSNTESESKNLPIIENKNLEKLDNKKNDLLDQKNIKTNSNGLGTSGMVNGINLLKNIQKERSNSSSQINKAISNLNQNFMNNLKVNANSNFPLGYNNNLVSNGQMMFSPGNNANKRLIDYKTKVYIVTKRVPVASGGHIHESFYRKIPIKRMRVKDLLQNRKN